MEVEMPERVVEEIKPPPMRPDPRLVINLKGNGKK